MAKSQAKRTKQLEKKKRKRNEKYRQVTRLKNASPAELLKRHSKAPILDCYVGDALETQGLGYVVISRQLASGEVAFAAFLIDRYCMGAKDAFGKIVPRSQYREQTEKMQTMGMRPIDPASARRVIEDSVEYAKSLGLNPHRDYDTARQILGDIDPAAARETFEMGVDGKPRFVNGPYQSAEECQMIISRLEQSCGPGGYDAVMSFDGLGGDVLNLSDIGELEFEDDFDEYNFDADEEELDDEEMPSVRVIENDEIR